MHSTELTPIPCQFGSKAPPRTAAEIIRRTVGADGRPTYVIWLSNPPTDHKRLQLLAARLQRTPIAIMPHKYTMEEWITLYAGWLAAEIGLGPAPHGKAQHEAIKSAFESQG